MSADSTPSRTPLPLVFLAAALFALAHTQSPLFFSNQNQYLLHGLADAGYGHLNHDWLSNTKDPTPLFSFLVNIGYRVGGLLAIQAMHFVLLMVYFAAMWSFVSAISTVKLLPFAALFTAAHAAMFRLLSVKLAGVDYPWYFQAGVAGQYVLGPGLQPSAFGVLLVMSVAAFARGRHRLAAALAAGTTLFHATYLLPAALLVGGYAITLVRSAEPRRAVGVCLIGLVFALPITIYVMTELPDGGVKRNGAAQAVLANVRIPHHAQITRWLDAVAGLQIAWIALGLFLLRRTAAFKPLLFAAVVAAVLTTVQAYAKNDAFALTFPWRISVLLVPVATAAVCVRIATWNPVSAGINLLAGFLLLLQAIGGVLVMELGLGYAMNEAEVKMLNFVREHAKPEDVYLIPAKIPPLASGPRGSASTSFTPPPRPKPGSNLIPVDLQRFRLATGAAIYVDFKSVPYATTDVHDWLQRLTQTEKWYEDKSWDKLETQEALKQAGITHIVIPRNSAYDPPIFSDGVEKLHEDTAYAVYRLR